MMDDRLPLYLILDYDGTLHDCAKIYIPAFRKAYAELVSLGLAQDRQIPDGEISCWLGYSSKEMWNTFLPSLSETQVQHTSQLVGGEMLAGVENGLAVLYDGAEDVLKALVDDGCRMIFLSNCTSEYMEQHRRLFRLDRFFSGYYCSQDFGYIPKYDIFPQIRNDFPGNYIIVGDRFHDMEIARRFGLSSVGCSYGYGKDDELQCASIIIDDIKKLPEAVESLRHQ